MTVRGRATEFRPRGFAAELRPSVAIALHRKDGPTFQISCDGLVVGHTAFEARGMPRGIVRGAFLPADGYESIRPLFRRDAVVRALPDDPDGEAVLRAYYEARADLHFEVSDDQGRAVPVEYVHVYEPVGAQDAFEVVARLAVPAAARDPGSRPRRSRPAT